MRVHAAEGVVVVASRLGGEKRSVAAADAAADLAASLEDIQARLFAAASWSASAALSAAMRSSSLCTLDSSARECGGDLGFLPRRPAVEVDGAVAAHFGTAGAVTSADGAADGSVAELGSTASALAVGSAA